MKPSTFISPDTIADIMSRGIRRAARTWLKNVTVAEAMNETDPWHACPKFWMNPFRLEYRLNDGKDRTLGMANFSDGLADALINNPGLIAAFESNAVNDVQAETIAKHVFSFKGGS